MKSHILHKALYLTITATFIVLGLTSCNDAIVEPLPPRGESVENTYIRTMLTADQMGIKVTGKLLTAVPSAFEEGSTGAALVKRLPFTISEINPNARLVLLEGNNFDSSSSAISPENMKNIVRIYADGGYIALVRPTYEQVETFGIALATGLLSMEQTMLGETFLMTDEQAADAARHSRKVERLNARMKNIQTAGTRADDTNSGDLFAEILILGPADYFMQEPVTDEMMERTPYISGQLADAAAEWLNEVEEKWQKAALKNNKSVPTLADAQSSINEMLDASETFTLSGHIYYRDYENQTRTEYGAVSHKFLSWGVHDMNANKDYYYIRQNVLLKLSSLFNTYSWTPGTTSEWITASGYNDYDRWYGAYLSQFETSMALSGYGNITLEDALPYTDNNNTSTSISVGTSSSTSIGITAGVNSQGVFNLGESLGWTTGTSFSMSTTSSSKDLAVVKNTDANIVNWTYKAGTLPKAYVETGGNVLIRKYYYRHTTPADILINDCNLKNEGCWSVSDPKDNYKFTVRSRPQTAALLFSYKNSDDNMPSKTEYTDGTTTTLEHTLLAPNRATQMWSMNVTINKWADAPITGAKAQLESTLAEKFPDAFRQRFSVADLTPTSINTITAYIGYSRSVFQSYYDDLQSYAADLGILQFTINWKCNDTSLSPKEGFCVTVTNFNGTVTLPLLTADYEAKDGDTLIGKLAGQYKITIADGATVTLRDAEIKGEPNGSIYYRWAGITCLGDATIILTGTNAVSGMHSNYPGIFVPQGSTLTIQGDGTLDVSCGVEYFSASPIPHGNASGIGSSCYAPSGNIVIAGGTINATGGNWSAGIGSCYDKPCGNITITGGNVTALGGSISDGEGDGPGIGSGSGTTCGDILISGGTVVSQGSYYSTAIGSAWQGGCGKITITSGVTSLTATKGAKSPCCIGAGYEGTCGSVSIGGTTAPGGITQSPYTYKP